MESRCFELVREIHLALEKGVNHALKEYDLTCSQMQVLLILRCVEGGSCEFKKLEKHLRIAQSTTVGLIGNLEKKGLVERFVNEQDRRVKLLRITQQGARLCDWAKNAMETTRDQLFSGITAEEKEQLFHLLQKMRKNVE